MKVLVIRFSSMGDIVLTTPVIRILKNNISASIHYLLKEKYASLLRNHPMIDKLFLWEKIEMEDLRNENYDLVIDLQRNLRSLLTVWKLNRKSVTYDKMRIRTWLYTHLRIDLLKNSHVAERYIASLQGLGLSNDDKGLNVYTTEEYNLHKVDNSKPLIGINLGGSFVTKRIPRHVIEPIIQDSRYFFILLGGKDVEELNDVPSNCLSLIGQTTLSESISIIEQCDIIVSGDSGLMHIAAAKQKPIIVVWGSTGEEYGFYPYYGKKSDQQFLSIVNEQIECNPCSKYGRKKCPKGHMNCLNRLNHQLIVNQIEHFLRPHVM